RLLPAGLPGGVCDGREGVGPLRRLRLPVILPPLSHTCPPRIVSSGPPPARFSATVIVCGRVDGPLGMRPIQEAEGISDIPMSLMPQRPHDPDLHPDSPHFRGGQFPRIRPLVVLARALPQLSQPPQFLRVRPQDPP